MLGAGGLGAAGACVGGAGLGVDGPPPVPVTGGAAGAGAGALGTCVLGDGAGLVGAAGAGCAGCACCTGPGWAPGQPCPAPCPRSPAAGPWPSWSTCQGAAVPPLVLGGGVVAAWFSGVTARTLSLLSLLFRLLASFFTRVFVLPLNLNFEKGTWTTAKPARGAPGNQPAPPPGFIPVVPKKRPRIDM